MWRWNPAPTWSASCSFPPSPRNLGLDAARALGERVKGRAGKVALTVDANDETLLDIVAALKPDMLQLHGNETPERVAVVRARFGLPVMKALPIAERADLSPIRSTPRSPTGCCSTRARRRRRPGRAASASRSTGRCSRASMPGIPFMLSGGLDAGNVAEAIAITRAPRRRRVLRRRARPGEKDPDKIRAFIRAARAADVLQLGEANIVSGA